MFLLLLGLLGISAIAKKSTGVVHEAKKVTVTAQIVISVVLSVVGFYTTGKTRIAAFIGSAYFGYLAIKQ